MADGDATGGEVTGGEVTAGEVTAHELRALLDGVGAALDRMRDGDIRRLRLARGSFVLELERTGPAAPPAATERQRPGAATEPDTAEPTAADHPPVPEGIRLTAPLVGVFYAAPGPGQPPFVAVGDRVEPGQQVGIIEAMKFMNPVVTDRPGIVSAVHVDNNHIVEFDQLLITLTPV